MSNLELAVIGGFGAGLFLRTFLPYLRKWLSEPQPFDWRFTLNAALAAVTGLIGGQFIFPAVSPDTAPALAFWMSLASAYTLQDVLRVAQKGGA